jgi:hypothetical protein
MAELGFFNLPSDTFRLCCPATFVQTEGPLAPVSQYAIESGLHNCKQCSFRYFLQVKFDHGSRFGFHINVSINVVRNPSETEVTLRLYPLHSAKHEAVFGLPDF